MATKDGFALVYITRPKTGQSRSSLSGLSGCVNAQEIAPEIFIAGVNWET